MCAPYTFSELEDVLANLPKNKATGYDAISNELLTNSGPRFKQYLLIFLNKILEEGSVPQNLNQGKCVLIHKVCRILGHIQQYKSLSFTTHILNLF